jgi:hypothetical protein
MKRSDTSWLWGVLLVTVGTLALVGNLGWVFNPSGTLWGLAFLLLGGLFLFTFYLARERWWALIPGFTLLGLGSVILLGGATWSGALFLGAIGAGFLAVFWADRRHWWAIIPGGTLLTLALVARGDADNSAASGGLFFLGLALTFLVVYLLPGDGGNRHRWAMYPAFALLALAGLAGGWFDGLARVWNYVWALALVGVGLYMLSHRSRGRQ